MLMFKGFFVFLLLAASGECPEDVVEKNIFSDSVYRFFNISQEQIDLVFVAEKKQKESKEIIFFKRAFRAKMFLKKIEESPLLDFVGISGGIFIEENDGKLEIKLLGPDENGYLETAPVSPNQIIVVALDSVIKNGLFGDSEADSFFDPVIRGIQDAKILEKFPQLSEKKIHVQDFESLILADTASIRITAENVCFRHLKNE